MTEEWIKETNELIEDWEAQKRILHDKYDQIENELINLEQRIINAHELISAYMNKHNIMSTTPENIKQGSLANKSYPQMLIEIAKQSNGILNVADTTDILLKANIGTDKHQIQHNICGALARSREHFVKIKRGQYRFTNHVQSKKRKERSGLRQAIIELKRKNPQMTSKEVLNYLVTSGFDFRGRKPTSAVNLTWGYLGYSKEGKQQKLPIENPSVLEIEVSAEQQARINPTSK